jgi:A/G-specific adenine glycosylase
VEPGDARLLLAWFAAHRRDLPWRGEFPRDPYPVLVSEVMLQQTQVDRVVEGFRRFVERFPTLEALAAATSDEVVEAFSGMGYYGRARRLHLAAQAIVARGAWPHGVAGLAALPGVGTYTSAAVAAFAFAGADPPVDGNVCRVAARVLKSPLPAGSAALARVAAALARELHAAVPCPEVFEALMELGATVCSPRAPRCPACPLRARCRGHAEAERLPLARPARTPENLCWVALWLVRADGAVLLRQVPDGALLGGLWLPPLAAATRGAEARDAAAALARAIGFAGALVGAATVRHAITHHRIEVIAFGGTWPAERVAEAAAGATLRNPAAPGLPTSSLLGKLARACSPPRQAGIDELLRARNET